MRGIISVGGYVPSHRLERAQISSVMGAGGGKGTRAVASHDEDTTTMGVEAARLAVRSAPAAAAPGAVWFATTDPAYLDKTNATAITAALRLPTESVALDFGGALRSGVGALGAALALGGDGQVLVVAADRRDGLPTGADESEGGDGAAAVLVGADAPDTPLLAELVSSASATAEMVDRWRRPGDRRSKLWEERFGENNYLSLGADAFKRALGDAALDADRVDRAGVTGMHARAVRSLGSRLGLNEGALADDMSRVVGQTGAAHPLLVLTAMLEREVAEGQPAGRILALVHLADGADVLLFRTTPALASWRPARPVAEQAATGRPLAYGKFLSWRGMVTVEPPRRPEPQRVSATAAFRSTDWKFGFVGSRDRSTGALHFPPARVSREGGAVDDMEPAPMADAVGTVVTFTVDRMVYSPSPPVVFAVVDFDGGGRFPVELTDVGADEVAIGDRVEMTFRRLFTADDLPDYFYKARPVRDSRPGLTAIEGGRS